TVPRTAESSAPAPAATRLRRARPLRPTRCLAGPLPESAPEPTTVAGALEGGWNTGRGTVTSPGGDADSSVRAFGPSSPTVAPRPVRAAGPASPGAVPERSATRARARRPATVPR